MVVRVIQAAVAAAFIAAAPVAARAADAPAVNPLDAAIANAALDWTGAYVGINAGVGFGDADTNLATFGTDGLLGGFQIGYNKQLGSVVIGVEGDIQGAGIDGSTSSPDTTASLNWFSTARGRVGYAFDSTLFYGTAGVAFAGAEVSANGAGGGSDDNTLFGLAAGAGIEQSITDNISLKAEYMFIDTEKKDFDTGTQNTKAEWDGHVMRFGANLKF